MDEDTRNVIDEYKHMPHEAIVADLDAGAHGLEIAIENVDRDFNMGTIIRNANAFGVRHVHIIGRRQWNKRGAMMTDKYLHVHYYPNADTFIEQNAELPIIAIDNVEGSVPLKQTGLPEKCVMVFGSEKAGISKELLSHATAIIAIEQRGSTRSVNVGVASGIAMYAWCERHVL
jgi:tRNA G18 (ribose-2'-O)-methylase SpoU